MAEFPAPDEGIVLTHFIVSADVERSRRFYADVLGGETVRTKRHPTPIGSAASSTSASQTSRPSTRSGARAGPSS